VVATVPPVPFVATTVPRGPLTAHTVPMIGPKKGQLIDYGRILGARAGPVGVILALVSGLLLLPLALAFAVRRCAGGGCVPGGNKAGYVPVLTGTSGVTQTENGKYY